ncbi:hypothetical protein llap_1391 [Limosa lapponica baueri]|uniref:Uncharacterized protein n=1 Tax=Limosa lapponica baueri TaxID=1758121 RepID=A0A2I0UQH2_LIMLA|nr:hypothetical protein llap_1391 [Limosa lapponica baueri]
MPELREDYNTSSCYDLKTPPREPKRKWEITKGSTDTVTIAAVIKEKEKSNYNVKPSSLAFSLDYSGPAVRRVIEYKFLTKRRRKPAYLLKRKEKSSEIKPPQ